MEYSKFNFCENRENKEIKNEKKMNFYKKIMGKLKEYGYKALRIYYFLYLCGIAVLYFFIALSGRLKNKV